MAERHSDVVLFDRLCRNDESAFRRLYERHRTPVYWYSRSLLRSDLDAEEVAADSFVALWKKRHSIVIHGLSALPWLLVTARNLSWNRRRSLNSRATVPMDDIDEPASQQLPLEEQIAQRMILDKVARLLESADPIDQELFRMCMIEGFAYKEAAARLDLTHGSVRNRLFRLRRHVQSVVAPA
ncbi:RNA polymerase sigma factor [Leucobacter triazinivorans]|nr:RNA polymerase sigma factor [Leucobacter triazinivorans]